MKQKLLLAALVVVLIGLRVQESHIEAIWRGETTAVVMTFPAGEYLWNGGCSCTASSDGSTITISGVTIEGTPHPMESK